MAQNKVSISDLDKVIKYRKKGNVNAVCFEICDGENVEIQVKNTISFADMSEFVDVVSEAVFVQTENGDTVYDPSRYQPAYLLCLISYYTNLKSEIGLERLCNIFYETDIVTKFMEHVSDAQIIDIEENIYQAIEFKKQIYLNSERIKLEYISNQLDNLLPVLKQNADMLAGVNPDEMSAAIQSLGNLDEEKLVNKVLEKKEDNVIEMKQVKKPRARKKKMEDVTGE